MPMTFAVKSVQLKICMTIASTMTLLFTQGRNCVSNLSKLAYISLGLYLSYGIHTWLGMTVEFCMIYMCSCSFWWPWPRYKVTVGRETKESAFNYLDSWASNNIKLAVTVGDFFSVTFTLQTFILLDHLVFNSCSLKKYIFTIIIIFNDVDYHYHCIIVIQPY